MPFVDRDLAGEDGRAASVAFLEDLVEVTPGTGVERFEAPIVENEELDAGETAQDAGIAAVTAGEREFREELGNPLVENRAVVAASLVTEGTGKPTFADPGRARKILPKNSPSTSSSIIGTIRARVNASAWCADCSFGVAPI